MSARVTFMWRVPRGRIFPRLGWVKRRSIIRRHGWPRRVFAPLLWVALFQQIPSDIKRVGHVTPKGRGEIKVGEKIVPFF